MTISTKTRTVIIVTTMGTIKVPIENLEAVASVRGWVVTGVQAQSPNPNLHLREEIVGQPIFNGLCGPMYGGEGIVRYEDWATYNMMSM